MRRVEKPWGYELIFAETSRYAGKRIHINAGHRLSQQYHELKDETILVEDGELTLELIEAGVCRTITLHRGDSHRIAPGVTHRMVAVTDVEFTEVSTPELDDVVRVADDYGREGTSKP